MQTTYSDMVRETGVSKPTVINVANELDPDKSHRSVEGRTTYMDEWLTMAVADKLKKKGLIKQATSSEAPSPAGEGQDCAQDSPKRRIVGPKMPSEQEKDSIQDTVQQLLDRVLKAEAEKNEMVLKAKDEKIELLTDQVKDLSERVQRLDDKVEAERSRYDELVRLQTEKFNALAAPKVPLWRRLLGLGPKQDEAQAGE